MITRSAWRGSRAAGRSVVALIASLVAIAGVLVTVLAGTGMLWLVRDVVLVGEPWRSPVDVAVLLGIAAVLPLMLGGPGARWAVAAASALLALSMPPGELAGVVLVLPFAVVVVWTLVDTIGAAGPIWWWTVGDLARVLAGAYAAVAALALGASVAGASALGVGEPIVRLTAVHYIYAGAAALVLAIMARDGAPPRRRRLATIGLFATAAAPPIVAVGFMTGWSLCQVGGAAVMAAGVCLTATFQLRAAVEERPIGVSSALLGVSGLAVWVPMVLAIAWAAGQHWNVPALSIPDMARTHGMVNAFAFVLCGLVGRHLQSPRVTAPVETLATGVFLETGGFGPSGSSSLDGGPVVQALPVRWRAVDGDKVKATRVSRWLAVTTELMAVSWTAAVVAVCATFSLSLLFWMVEPETAGNATIRFTMSLQTGEYGHAYDRLCGSAQRALSRSEFDRYRGGRFGASVRSGAYLGDTEYPDEQTMHVSIDRAWTEMDGAGADSGDRWRFELRREEGRWRVCDVRRVADRFGPESS